MSRLADLRTVIILLASLASNCFQASQVDLDSIASPVPSLTQSAGAGADGPQLLIATNDDDSDDVLHTSTHWVTLTALNPGTVIAIYRLTYLTPISFPQFTALKL